MDQRQLLGLGDSNECGDDQGLFAHVGTTAIASVFIILFGSLAVLRELYWNVAA